MSGSLRERGLPDWLLTPRMAVVSGIVTAIVLTTGFRTADWVRTLANGSPADRLPLCYQLNREPLWLGNATYARDNRDVARQDHRLAAALERLQHLELACRPDACPQAAAQPYRSAVRAYVHARVWSMHRLAETYGEAGLRHARFAQSAPEHAAAERGIRERYEAGAFDLDGVRQLRTETRMLVLAGGSRLVPCFGGE